MCIDLFRAIQDEIKTLNNIRYNDLLNYLTEVFIKRRIFSWKIKMDMIMFCNKSLFLKKKYLKLTLI